MKFYITCLILSLSLPGFASIIAEPTLSEVLSKQTCKVTVVNKPIDFEKQSNIGKTGNVYLAAFPKNLNTVRRLEVGREMTISKIEFYSKEELALKDKSIAYLCVDYVRGSTPSCEDMSSLTITQIEEHSNSNLRFDCSKDGVVLF